METALSISKVPRKARSSITFNKATLGLVSEFPGNAGQGPLLMPSSMSIPAGLGLFLPPPSLSFPLEIKIPLLMIKHGLHSNEVRNYAEAPY